MVQKGQCSFKPTRVGCIHQDWGGERRRDPGFYCQIMLTSCSSSRQDLRVRLATWIEAALPLICRVVLGMAGMNTQQVESSQGKDLCLMPPTLLLFTDIQHGQCQHIHVYNGGSED